MRNKWLLLLILSTLTSGAEGYAIIHSPSTIVKQRQRAASVQVALPALQPSFGDDDETSHEPNFLVKAAKKFTSWFPWVKNGKEADGDIEEELAITRRERDELRNEIQALTKPFPWPVRAFTGSLMQTVTRALEKEEHKAKPLLKYAKHLIEADDDVRAALGTPIKMGHIISQRTEETWINGKKTVRIFDTFEVQGRHESGEATFIADQYKRGHIKALRVNVRGIHYDIDV